MIINRRALLVAASGLAVRPTLAEESPLMLTAYERETGGRIGLYAENLSTGAKIAWRAEERFVMCSTFKASLAAFVLARVDHGQDQLENMIGFGPEDLLDYAPAARQQLAQNLAQNPAKAVMSVADMCEAAVELSDNTCANLLLARVGGPAALTTFWRSMGDAVTRLDHNEPELNRSAPGNPNDTTTPAAMAANLRRFLLGEVLSLRSREYLTGWMLNCKTGNNRLRAGLPGNWRVADKTGNNGTDAACDVAVTWPSSGGPTLVCAYTQGGSPTAPQLEAIFAEIGRAVGRQLS